MYKITRQDLARFKQIQKHPIELGGKIILSNKGIIKIITIEGSKRFVPVAKFPMGILWFHHHPCICSPPIKPHEDILDRVLAELDKKKGRDFPIDILVQPISDDDLLAMTESIQRKKTCMMMVFTPEGVYIISERGTQCQARGSCGSKLPDPNARQTKKNAKKYLEMRDDVIIENQQRLIKRLRRVKSVAIKKRMLYQYQKLIGKKICRIQARVYPEILLRYYPWTTRQIVISKKNCFLNSF